jgi:hypothetical protein
MALPRAQTPGWFVEKLNLQKGSFVISVDDDQSIHQIWSRRLASVSAIENGIQHQTFSSLEQLETWAKENKSTPALFFVDYEFLGQTKTGLHAIELSAIQSCALLVTSRYEERHVREEAARLGVKILPKALAPFVPMTIG